MLDGRNFCSRSIECERGEVLALPMALTAVPGACVRSKASQGQWTWPRAGLETLQEILVGLAKEVQVTDAMRVLQAREQRGAALLGSTAQAAMLRHADAVT